MKTEKYCLILAVVTGILCTPVLGEVELPRGPDVTLLGQANPTLAGIRALDVTIVPPYTDPNKDGLVWRELESKIVSELKKAGITSSIKIEGKYSIWSYYVPELRVYIDMLKLPDSQKYVFRIQISLARTVYLAKEQRLFFEADVWKTKPVMQVESIQNTPAKVTNIVLEQTDTFITAYRDANPKGVQPADANQASVSQKEPAKPADKSEVTEYKFVASKNSRVFHRPECHWVEQIKPENMIGYNSRDEAVKAGKRPCKMCKP